MEVSAADAATAKDDVKGSTRRRSVRAKTRDVSSAEKTDDVTATDEKEVRSAGAGDGSEKFTLSFRGVLKDLEPPSATSTPNATAPVTSQAANANMNISKSFSLLLETTVGAHASEEEVDIF